jgi:ribonuclease BN (tRNA processing enzyme)
MIEPMKLTVLGSSTPYPRPDNPCSGYLLQHDDTAIWVDAGTGTLGELQRHVSPAALTAIWISHSHADHTADLLTAYYALRFGEVELEHPLPLFCPTGLRDRLTGFLGPQSKKGLPRVFDFIELDGWGEQRVGAIDLAWGPLDHGMPAFGLSASAAGTTIAYSGDTAFCAGLVELAEGAQTLVCEVGYAEHPQDEPAVHCTPEDAGRAAREAGVKRLVLTHIDGSLDRVTAIARARSAFDGEIGCAVPGFVVD